MLGKKLSMYISIYMLGDEQEKSLTDFWCPLHPEALVANGLLHTFMVIRKLKREKKNRDMV